MIRHVLAHVIFTLAVTFDAHQSAALGQVVYPEVKVDLAESYKPDAAFNSMRKLLSDAVARRDSAALFGVVGPNFMWTIEGVAVDDFDWGRGPLHNFKVVFGFRQWGKDTDGAVDDGPYWETLATFASDGTYEKESDNLVCGPISATAADETVFEEAYRKVEAAGKQADWYFTLSETTRVTSSPADTGPPVATVGRVALPVVSVYPALPSGRPALVPSHLEVLLPTGKTGWIPVAAARMLSHEQLCYAKTPQGDWKIVAYSQPAE